MNLGPAFWLLCAILALGGLVQAVQAIILHIKGRGHDSREATYEMPNLRETD